MPHAWVRALVPSTGASAALALGGVCAVLAVMGAMRFGLWEPGDRSGGGAMALPRSPTARPAPVRPIRLVRADARAFTAARSGTPTRRAPRASRTIAVLGRRVARGPVSAPSAQPPSRRPAPRPVPSPAAQERAASPSLVPHPAPPRVAVPVVHAPVPHVPPPVPSLPHVVRDVPGTLGRTVDAALTSAGQTADAAEGAARQVARPATAPLAEAVPAPARQAAGDVVGGLLPDATPSD